jgi:hypothetical protein
LTNVGRDIHRRLDREHAEARLFEHALVTQRMEAQRDDLRRQIEAETAR